LERRLLTDPELLAIQELDEGQFTRNYVIPLFRGKGYIGVEYVHGRDEYGRDVYFYDLNRFGRRRDIAAQVKVGHITGTPVVQEVINQARAAFTNPYVDISTNEERRICEMYVITSGSIPVNARTQIINGLRDLCAIHFLDGTKVLEETNKVHFEILEYSIWEERMRQLGLDALLGEADFKKHVNESLELLLNDRKESPLHALSELPKVLLAHPRMRGSLQPLEPRDKDYRARCNQGCSYPN
jgi:hypothetical protein